MAETGNGTTITFSGGLSTTVYSMTGLKHTLPDIEDSVLTTETNETVTPGDLNTLETFDVTIPFVSTAALPTTGTVQTITVTSAVPSGASSGATSAGTGYINGVQEPGSENNTRKETVLTIKMNGKTGPAFTVAS